jgi:uncharacterized membrane protein
MPWTDEEMDRAIGILLRVGVSVAATVVLAGGVWLLAGEHSLMPDHHTFHGEPAELRGVAGVLQGITQGHAATWIQFGILLLIATPVARVAFSVFAFAAQRDWTYVTITVIVLAILVYSLSGGGL